MSLTRRSILTVQALLTIVFIGAAAFTFFGSPFGEQPLTVQSLPLGEAPQALRLTVRQTGVAAVTMRELRSTDLPFDALSAEHISLSKDGELVPIYVHGDGNDATLYFYAQAISNSAEMPAVYWLAPGRGKSMSQRDRSPEAPGVSEGTRWQRWEENSSYHPFATGDDNWFSANVYAPDSLELTLAGIQPTGGPGTLTLRVWSSNQSPANPDHHMRVSLNGVELVDHFWDGISQETLQLLLEPGILRRQGNRLLLEVPGDTGAAGESIYLDWLELEYEGDLSLNRGQLHFHNGAGSIRVTGAGEGRLAFDVSDPADPVLLLNTEFEDNVVTFAGSGPGSTYLVLNPRDAIRPEISAVPEWVEPLRVADRGADYIAIVPDSGGFRETLEPLMEHRRDQSLRATTVSIQQIYDEFGFGRQSPEAIRDFLAYTYNEWRQPRPRFVLFVGDASYDVNDYLGAHNQNLLSTKLVQTQFAGYVASDSWFTMFDASGLPVIATGRLPAQNARQLSIMVDKILNYESGTSSPWRSRALLVADDEPRFDTSADWLAEQLLDHGFFPQKLYMTQNEDIHDSIISALNHGVNIVHFVGHGGIDVWGDEGVLRGGDVIVLKNGNRLPIFTTFTSLNGAFHHPSDDSLAESLLWTRGGGIVAAVAPSGRTYSAQQTPLATEFYLQLLSGESPTLGEALLRAKQVVSQEPSLSGTAHIFNVLGDPALQLQRPEPLQ